MMMRFEVHRVLDSQVADVPGRRRIEVVMGGRVQRVMHGQVPDRPVHGRRPDVIRILEQLRERPSLPSLDLQVRDFRRKVFEGL